MGRGIDGSEDVLCVQNFLKKITAHCGFEAPKPLISGSDLIEAGFKPGPQMRQLLEEAYDLQLGGYSKSGILKTLKRG